MQAYSQDVKDKVCALRKQGFSLNEIHSKVNIPKTTIRGWIKEIILTDAQKEKFRTRTLEGLQRGRILAQELQKDLNFKRQSNLFRKGIKEIGKINNKNLFMVGIALYWAEGFKNKFEHRLGFCNSDPKMIKIYVLWLKKCLGVQKEDLVLRVALNESYKKQAEEIQNYWSELLDISAEQFTKPFFQKSIWKKQFSTNSYKGVLRIHVKNSLELLLKMRGWIEGLKMLK